MSKNNIIKLVVISVIGLVLGFMPIEWIPLANMDIAQQRMLAVFVFTALMWVFEPVSAWVTSIICMLIITFTVSDGGLNFMREGIAPEHLIDYEKILASFADPIIILFLGGFVIAEVASSSGLDKQMAYIILKPFGHKSKYILLGIMLTTAIISMFVSDSATSAMMFAMLAPVFKNLPADEKGSAALVTGIPISAVVGGTGTPIGTPPNAIALKYLNDPNGLNLGLGFGDWVVTIVPCMLVIIFVAWFILLKLFPFKSEEINLKIEKGDVKPCDRWKFWTIICTTILTIILWMTDTLTGLNISIVALIPIVVFSITGIFKAADIQKLEWSVLWMVAGGFALGAGMEETGLAKNIVVSIPFDTMSPALVIIFAGLLCWGLSVFISNTATAAMMMPMMLAIGLGMGSALTPFGGITALLVIVALAASYAVVLPISTPSNGIAYSTGLVSTKQMATAGVIIGLFALTLAIVCMFTIWQYIVLA
ncbi:MAG: DASS family sodium-coupled anion symporter [Paludibacteraceae bacterium]|nr:DASS family sodium-coupled anion symporter [Paludibacteraceae bacterium]